MSTKKGTTRKGTKASTAATASPASEDEQVTQTTTSSSTVSAETTSVPSVSDWTQESKLVSVDEPSSSSSSQPQKKSVLDFDRTTVQGFETRNVSSLSNDDLLMVLIRRGEEQKNPVISGGCERLLRQINRERITPHRQARSGPHDPQSTQVPQSTHFRGRQQNRQRYAPQQLDVDDEEQHQPSSPPSYRGGGNGGSGGRPFRGPQRGGQRGPRYVARNGSPLSSGNNSNNNNNYVQ